MFHKSSHQPAKIITKSLPHHVVHLYPSHLVPESWLQTVKFEIGSVNSCPRMGLSGNKVPRKLLAKQHLLYFNGIFEGYNPVGSISHCFSISRYMKVSNGGTLLDHFSYETYGDLGIPP